MIGVCRDWDSPKSPLESSAKPVPVADARRRTETQLLPKCPNLGGRCSRAKNCPAIAWHYLHEPEDHGRNNEEAHGDENQPPCDETDPAQLTSAGSRQNRAAASPGLPVSP